MTNSTRPWWADRGAVEQVVERKEFDATLDYLGGLADAIEHRIAYGTDDPVAAAASALVALNRLDWHRRREAVVVQTWGGEPVLVMQARWYGERPEPLPFQLDDPAHVMVCACSHQYTDHSDVGCSHCPECGRFRYSHDTESSSNG